MPTGYIGVLLSCLILSTLVLHAQKGQGELRLRVVDATGLEVEAGGELISQATEVRQVFTTDRHGLYTARLLPFGIYRLRMERAGFAPHTVLLEIRSEVPVRHRVVLGVAPVETTVVVHDQDTLLDPHRTGTVHYAGADRLREHHSSGPSRGVLELVNMQPGWLLEANGVLHPRGSEYNTQYVIDGIPITDNRSPSFAPGLELEDVESMSVFTAGYPAEYGRKLGGVVEVNSRRDPRPGAHGRLSLDGGSFASRTAQAAAQWRGGKNLFAVGAHGTRTDRFLDPPVEDNFTNRGTGAGWSARLERDVSARDRLWMNLHHRRSVFQVPNEPLQQRAGQRQDRRGGETAGQIGFQKVLSPWVLVDARGMGRELIGELWSNALATPILAEQRRGFREAYAAGSVSVNYSGHEMKAGGEAIFTAAHERFGYRITEPGFFDHDLPQSFHFEGRRRGQEAALYVQDLIRRDQWTFSLGLRWDRYSLLVSESAWSPRLGVARFFPRAGLVLRASYDRAFETPAIEGLLLAGAESSRRLAEGGGLPLRPSRSHFLQAGFAKSLFGRMRLEANYYRRHTNNFADDSVLLNTGVSFPITFDRARIHGLEARIELPRRGPLSGFLSYSNLTGTGRLPLTGGLFLEALTEELLGSTASFPITQDQRNTLRGRLRCQLGPRVWLAVGAGYGSGLPVETEGELIDEDLARRYPRRILERVNLERGRVRPQATLDAGAGITLWNREHRALRVQMDAWNLTGRLNLINFAGLFSGTALGAPRSFAVRMQAEF